MREFNVDLADWLTGRTRKRGGRRVPVLSCRKLLVLCERIPELRGGRGRWRVEQRLLGEIHRELVLSRWFDHARAAGAEEAFALPWWMTPWDEARGDVVDPEMLVARRERIDQEAAASAAARDDVTEFWAVLGLPMAGDNDDDEEEVAGADHAVG